MNKKTLAIQKIKSSRSINDTNQIQLRNFAIACLIISLINFGSAVFVRLNGGPNDLDHFGLMIFVFWPSFILGVFLVSVSLISTIIYKIKNKRSVLNTFLIISSSMLALVLAYLLL